MLGFPPSTEFNKRIPKQKFYENAAVPAAVKRLFADQLRCIYWRNKLAVSTLNLTAGERVTETELSLAISGLSLDAVYDGLVRQIARLQGESWNAAYSIAENIQRSAEREKLQKQIAALENKIRKEKQFNRQVEMNAELKQLKKNLEQLTKEEL